MPTQPPLKDLTVYYLDDRVVTFNIKTYEVDKNQIRIVPDAVDAADVLGIPMVCTRYYTVQDRLPEESNLAEMPALKQ